MIKLKAVFDSKGRFMDAIRVEDFARRVRAAKKLGVGKRATEGQWIIEYSRSLKLYRVVSPDGVAHDWFYAAAVYALEWYINDFYSGANRWHYPSAERVYERIVP